MHITELDTDVLYLVAEYLNSVVELGSTCRRMHSLLLVDCQNRARIFCKSRGLKNARYFVQTWALDEHSRLKQQRLNDYDIICALMKRPSFVAGFSDNQLFDIAMAGLRSAVSYEHRREHASTWMAILPRYPELVDSRTLISMFKWGQLNTLRRILSSGIKLRIPEMTEPFEIIVAVYEGQSGNLKFLLEEIGPSSPLEIKMDFTLVGLDVLKVFLNHYKDSWKENLKCAKQLRSAYNKLETPHSQRYRLLRSFDPYDVLTEDELLRKLKVCIQRSDCEEDTDIYWDEFSGILENGRIGLNSLSGKEIRQALSPTQHHHIAEKLLEYELPRLHTADGITFLESLSDETNMLWDTGDGNWALSMRVGYNSYLYAANLRGLKLSAF